LTDDFDIVITGAGAAGTAAAVSAAEAGRSTGRAIKIALIERGNQNDWGGNSRWTTANLQMTNTDQVNSTLYADLISDSQGMFPKEHASVIVSKAAEVIDWVGKKGVTFEKLKLRTSQPRMAPVGGGFAIISALRKSAQELGVEEVFETISYKLSQDGSGAINGIYVRDKVGRSRLISCRAAILSGGGFEGNKEMLARYIGREASFVAWEVPGTRMHMGECINMALEIGANPSGQYSGFHGFAVDIRSNAPVPPLVLGPSLGILINMQGVRFTDEGVPFDSLESITQAIIQQPENRAFLILDIKSRSLPGFETMIGTEIPPIEATRLDDLADLINVPRDILLDTVAKFNRAAQSGGTDKASIDHLQTFGISPKKSSRALTIDKPPFFCYPVAATVEFTWGGIETDTRSRVVATNGSPIHGLFAAGEIVGLNYHHYTGGSSVMRSLVFGRIAGAEAAQLTFQEKS
jgi:tricarballylate dehydrogenase